MNLLDNILDPPSYGYEKNGAFYAPTHLEILKEFVHKINIFRSKKNWLPCFSWMSSLCLLVPLIYFLFFHFSIPLAIAGFFYSMVAMGSHGTFWLHRYCTHRAFRFKNGFVRTLCRNLVIKVIPEEIYTVSHHVHHKISDKPGDPYNVQGGWLYCFLADANHQTIRKDLSEKQYSNLCKLLTHSGVKINSYAQYQKWGSLCHPFFTVGHYFLNWTFWFCCFYLVGGMALATALMGSASLWALGVRTFNFMGHGGGDDLRREGIDFNTKDMSVNQLWPGYVAGEWHNNHHLYPYGARSGFLPHQLDLPWLFIKFLALIGIVTTYRDYKANFYRDYYEPYLKIIPK